jgi:hypothetical protein
MQQTSGSSSCCCGDGDEVVDDCFVVVAFSSLSPSFLDCGGGGGEGAVGVVGEVDMVVFLSCISLWTLLFFGFLFGFLVFLFR